MSHSPINDTQLSEVSSVNQTVKTVLTATLPKKRPPSFTQKGKADSKKRPKPGNNSTTTLVEETDRLTNLPNDSGDPDRSQLPRINHAIIAGEDPDGFISLESLQSFLGTTETIPENNISDPSPNSVISTGFKLALELRAAKKPIFETATLTNSTDVEPDTLFILPHRDADLKTVINVFSLSDMTSKSARKVAILVGTNRLPSVSVNAPAVLNQEEVTELVVRPNEKIAALDEMGFTIFNLMYQAGKARWVADFDVGEHTLVRSTTVTKLHDFKVVNKSPTSPSLSCSLSIVDKIKQEVKRTVPVFENTSKNILASAYASRMFATPASHIEKSALHEKQKAEGADKNIAELIAHSGPKNPLSYGALGGSLNVLHYLSIAAYTAKHQTIMQVANRISERSLCAGSPVLVVRFLRSWAASYNSLSVFGRLEWKLGKHRGILRAHQYAALPDSLEHSSEYYRLLAGEGEVGGDVSSHIHTIPYLKAKIENLFLLIFVATNMKYKYQIAMLQSLDRFTNFLEVNDMGDGNPVMLKLMEVTTVEYLNNLERIRSKIDASLVETATEILDLFDCVPDLSPDGIFQEVYQRLSIDDTRGATAMIISQGHISNIAVNSTSDIFIANLLRGYNNTSSNPFTMQNDSTNPSPPIDPRKRKSKKSKRNQALLAASAINLQAAAAIQSQNLKTNVAQSVSNNNKPAPTGNNPNGTGPSTDGATKIYLFYSSTKGCNKGISCTHSHETPSKNSEAWNRINNLLPKFKLQPSDDFNSAN